MPPRLPATLQGTFVASIVGAALIFCCAAYSGVGVAMQLALQGQSGAMADPALARMMELQRSMAIVSVVLLMLQLGTATGLVVGGALGLSGRPIGRPITLAALASVAIVVLIEIGTAVWSWSQVQGIVGGAGPMSAEESQVVAIASAAGMLPTACWVFLKLALVVAGAAALLSGEARAFYETVGPEGLRAGPRG